MFYYLFLLAQDLTNTLNNLEKGSQPSAGQTPKPATEEDTVFQTLDAHIRLAARRRTLIKEQENVIPLLNVKVAVDAAEKSGK